jgi:hypothetical protein
VQLNSIHAAGYLVFVPQLPAESVYRVIAHPP